MSTGSQLSLANLIVGRAKPPSEPGEPQRHFQAGTGQLRRWHGPHPAPSHLGWRHATSHCSWTTVLVPCFTAFLLACWGWRSLNTFCPGRISVQGEDQVLFYVSPINSSLQHLERRRQSQAVHQEVFGAARVCPSLGTTRASPPGSPLQQRDVGINQGKSSTGAHR